MESSPPLSLSTEEFLELSQRAKLPIFDVRAPCEYKHAHIPGAISLPLFSDEERAMVGTKYKNAGKQKAILLGLEFVGPKLAKLVSMAKNFSKNSPHILVHCWRGGMRSQSVAWLLRLAGFQVTTLEGGYKNYRQHVLAICNQKYPELKVIGGMTGSGKTKLIQELKMGKDPSKKQILDLEGLANHKGSAFGALGNLPQPSTEQFENDMAKILSGFNPNEAIWLEDESRCIGSVHIPQTFYNQMREAPVFVLEKSKEERIKYLMEEYGHFNKEDLLECSKRVEKRLGGLRAKEVLTSIEEGRVEKAISIILEYYDKTYLYGLQKRSSSCVKAYQ